MSRIKCYLVEHTGRSRYHLRRYSAGQERCGKYGCHNANGPVIGESADDPAKDYHCSNPPARPADSDPRWPTQCDTCGYKFAEADHWQVFGDPLYRRVDTGEEMTLRDAPAGAMWYQPWYKHFYNPGPDGNWLMCKLPDGTDWCIDGRANNCTMPDDAVHKCWVRTGAPPDVDVGKGGNTCAAGAGSIATPGYHGFLRNGWLEQC